MNVLEEYYFLKKWSLGSQKENNSNNNVHNIKKLMAL